MSSQPAFSPSPESSARRLRAIHSREPRSSQVGLRSSQMPDNESLLYEQDGQHSFLPLPFPDDPDDLNYEDSDVPAASSSDREEGAIAKGKERAGEIWSSIKKEGVRDDISGDRESYSDEDGGAYEERPNKYSGRSKKTWMGWTRRERQEITAQEKIRARDLSIHLFNAFALKKRARRMVTGEDSTATPAAAGSLQQEINEAYSESSFAPSKIWTGWPMPPHIVPRVDESRDRDVDDMWTMRMEPDGRPSAELEECFMAQMLQSARDRFNAREWKEASSGSRMAASNNEGGERDSNVPEKDCSDFEESSPTLKPVILADDEKAKRVLRPTARHVLTKFDELLTSLNQAREAYITTGGGSEADERIETEVSAGESTGRKRRKLSPVTGPTSDEDMQVDQEERQNADPSSQPSPVQGPAQQTRTKRKGGRRRRTQSKSGQVPQTQSFSQAKRQKILGKRDWGDVLGLASMTGWTEPVVMRAARRCAELFGEDMIFRIMGEGKVHLEQTTDDGPVWRYTDDDDDEEDRRTALDKTAVPSYIGKLKEYVRFCPVTECPRHTKGFSRTWNFNKHMKERHPGEPVIRSEHDDGMKSEHGGQSRAGTAIKSDHDSQGSN